MVSMPDLPWVVRSYGGRLETRSGDPVGDRLDGGGGRPPAPWARRVIGVMEQYDVARNPRLQGLL
jgi:hypothetical protein